MTNERRDFGTNKCNALVPQLVILCVVVILLHDGPSSGHVQKHSQAMRGVPRSMACI